VTIGFGGIANYEEVVRMFKAADTANPLHYLRDLPDSKPTRRVVEPEFDSSEQGIQSISNYITERDGWQEDTTDPTI
jgi:hypothetical protein